MERTLDITATEIGGIAHTLYILSTALDPSEPLEHLPEAFNMSLFSLAQHLERIQVELDEAHMKLEVKPAI